MGQQLDIEPIYVALMRLHEQRGSFDEARADLLEFVLYALPTDRQIPINIEAARLLLAWKEYEMELVSSPDIDHERSTSIRSR